MGQSPPNIIIVTTDGYRWQELFNGADSVLLFNSNYVKDIELSSSLYWDSTIDGRRKKLMPFVWNYISKKGEIWGNRKYDNKVSVSNPYHLSYAGYSEIFTGLVDNMIIRNLPRNNTNKNLFQFINEKVTNTHDVAVFSSWNLLKYILNSENNKLNSNCGYQTANYNSLSLIDKLSNQVQEVSKFNKLPTRSDLLTFTLATEYMTTYHPSVLYISFGETDEYAHQGKYDQYLQYAHQFDYFLSEIWRMVQSDSKYKDNTTLFVTTDHGRGSKNWTEHGPFIGSSKQTWFIQLGNKVAPNGEMKTEAQKLAKDFAQTLANYLGINFIKEY